MKEKSSSTSGIKNVLKIVCVFCVLIVFLAVAQRILVPKYTGQLAEGSLIEEYYQCQKNNDVLFFGDSEMYYNFSPKVLSDEYDINAYVRGSANQTVWQSYYLLLDSLQYETPKAVVLSVSALMKEESDSEAYNRMTIDGMEWSQYKYDCVKASVLEEENVLSYVFPILRYHSRWSELSKEDFKYFFGSPSVSERGYIEKTEVVPMGELPSVRPLENYEFGDKALTYLDLIRQVCEKNNISLILVKAPSQYPHWYDEWDEQVVAYAEEYGLTYVNLLKYSEEIGLDFSVDTFDGGLHLNKTGAEKNTKYFGKILLEEVE